jgi:hypothetical protein
MANKILFKKKHYQVLLGLLPDFLSVFVVLFMIIISIKGLWFCVRILEKTHELFIFGAIIFCVFFLCFWIWIAILVYFSLKSIYYYSKVKVVFNDSTLTFAISENNAVNISRNQIEGSWSTPTKLTIFLKYQGEKYKFCFLKKFYNRSSLKEIEELMKVWGQYIEERDIIKQKVKENSLNCLSAKNNFLTVLHKVAN